MNRELVTSELDDRFDVSNKRLCPTSADVRPKMSKQTDLMQLEKCIASQFWYVATILHQKELNDRSRHHRDANKLANFINSCVEQLDQQKWIAYNLLLKIENNEQAKKRLLHEEFACTLKLLETQIPQHVRVELLRLCKAVRAAVENTEVPECNLSQESLQCLEINMLEQPAMIHWIINGLLCIWLPTTFAQTDSLLQQVYSSSLKKLLDTLPRRVHESSVGNATFFSIKNGSHESVNLAVLLSILSKLELTDEKENEMLEWLFPALLETTNTDDIELAFYSRKSLKFFRAWHEFLDEFYGRSRGADDFENAMKISRIMFTSSDESSVALNANEIFKRVVRRKTLWLSEILDVCYVLLMNEEHEMLEKILGSSALERFWLPLLLKLLKDCPNMPTSENSEKGTVICNALKFVLKKLATESNEDSTISLLTSTLENHLKVLNWILENKANYSPSFSSPNVVCPNFSVKYALNLLQSHSVLAVLKMTTNIHEKSYNDIYSLLSESDSSRNTFQAYRTMLSAIRAILACEFYNEKYKKVAEHLDDMEKSIGILFPLDLRLQVIENIFSIMFLRYEHFVDADSASDIGEEDFSSRGKESMTVKSSTDSAIGFVCNKYATREILARLRRSLKGLELESTDQKKDGTLSLETSDYLEKNMRLVSQALADASWRLELLTSLEFVKREGTPDVDPGKLTVFDSPAFGEEIGGFSTNSKNKSLFYQQNDDSSDESEFGKSDFEGSSETGSQGNATNTRRRKRSKNLSSPLSKSSTNASKLPDGTLNSMLASNESLVVQCLWKSDYERASQVIEMFRMKNTPLDGEIIFSRAMRMFRKEMRAQWNNSDSVGSPDGISDQSTLEKIRKAVQGGFQTSRTTNQIETFLASHESSVRLLNTDSTSVKEILTMASLDLALTMPQTHQDSIKLSDVAMKYLKSCKRLTNTRYHVFFESIYKLLYENKDNFSVREILCDARIPLSVKEAREKKDYWSRLKKKLNDFRRSLVEQYENNLEETGMENSMGMCDENFQDVISMCENGEFYLPRVYAHLKLLRTIVPDNFESLGENSHLLKIPLDTYIGDQIFRLNVELEEVETIASQLRVNLVHSILVNSCPKLTYSPEVHSNVNDTWGFLILNKCCEDDFSSSVVHEPNQCVGEILSDLIEAIRKQLPPGSFTLRHSEARKISEKEEIRQVLEKTHRLASLDLSNLSFGHHTLAFFINVWNLLVIHALLEIWSKDPPIEDLRHEISLSSVGYSIGDLGTVSLAALRTKLLGESQLWGSRWFSQTEELNEPAWQDLDVPHEPRVLFAMINEHEDSPIVRVYGLKTLDDELETSMTNYIRHHVNGGNDLQRARENTEFASKLVQLYEDLQRERTNRSTDEMRDTSLEEESVSTIEPKTQKPFCYSYRINFSYNEESSEMEDHETKLTRQNDEEFPWQSRIVKPSLLQYLEGHCWLLSYLVQRIHEESPTILDSNCQSLGRTAALENLLKSSWINDLKYLYDNNETVAGLRKITPTTEIWKIFESLLVSEEYDKCLEILLALPDSLVSRNTEIQRLTDKILVKLITSPNDRKIHETMKYVYRIKDEHVLAEMILENANELPVKVCQESLMHVLSHRNKDKLPIHCKSRMNEILCRVTVFYKMVPYCTKKNSQQDDNWHDVVYHTEKTHPVRIVKSLIDANQFELCLEWLEFQAVSSEIHSLITQDLLIGLLNNDETDYKHSLKLLRALPAKKSVNLCQGVLSKLQSIEALRFVIEYLQENAPSNETLNYSRALFGVDILEHLDEKERRSYLHLTERPLLMLEQMLMNCRLDSLQKIVLVAREKHHKFHLYTEQFDETVRFYAKKSLDFRVVVQPDAIDKIKDASTSSNKSQSGDFLMPINIPTKEEWVPNDKARECSCCRVVIFSMFNRRHHCRRCGRVVCGACSPQRMKLASYSTSVPVRVCNDCKSQTLVQSQTTPSTPSSDTFDCWRLNVDETHNKTLREEFSFENAPNISLCLAILNLHSDHEAYSNFLFDRCDEMKCLLRPDSEGRINPEIDHALIIKMIKSLLVAAKVKCAELGLNTGLTHCDRFLSQVDLIATLVNSDCSYLIPRTDKDDHLEDHTLRRLRDMLTEKEEWTIALDVSTKTGLDTQGVWAAWGTTCLKVGNYERARDKFTHCLEKVSREDSDDWVMLSYPGDSSNSSQDFRKRTASLKPQEGLKNRPNKDPPLLTEILQILERRNPNDAYAHQSAKPKVNGVQEILNTLNSLKAISQGHYAIGQSNTALKNVRYQESLYYLFMYGSFNSILEFFMKHGEYEKCLSYILENEVEPELFMSCLFMPCLKNGCMMNLCESMRSKDPSLVAFKKYLMYTCHSLERKQLLHTLHQLQLFMKDYVRAAMTCIRFYITDATSYEDLCSRTRLLVEAQKHLETELQLETFGKKRRKSVTSTHSGQNNLTLEMDPIEIDRHINTISRQMEIAKFLGHREREGKSVGEFMNKLSCMDSETSNARTVPTLFGNQQEKTHLAVLAILCGRDVEEGFGIAFRIMQDYNLRPQKIYSLVGHMLALDRNVSSIEQLIKCCRSSGAPNSAAISDRVLAHCVKLLLDLSRADSNPSPKDQIDGLIRIITDVELKIESYIESRQLKAAYLLAVKHSRAQDIKKILKEADRLGQIAIKSICTKWLQQTQKSRGDL